MKIHLAVITAVLAAGCSTEKTDAVDAVATGHATAQQVGMQEDQHAEMSPAHPTTAADAPGAGTSATATGTVDKTDAVAGTITISHGPVEALNWPAMTIPFKATPEQVASVQAGQQVSFAFTSNGVGNPVTPSFRGPGLRNL